MPMIWGEHGPSTDPDVYFLATSYFFCKQRGHLFALELFSNPLRLMLLPANTDRFRAFVSPQIEQKPEINLCSQVINTFACDLDELKTKQRVCG